MRHYSSAHQQDNDAYGLDIKLYKRLSIFVLPTATLIFANSNLSIDAFKEYQEDITMLDRIDTPDLPQFNMMDIVFQIYECECYKLSDIANNYEQEIKQIYEQSYIERDRSKFTQN